MDETIENTPEKNVVEEPVVESTEVTKEPIKDDQDLVEKLVAERLEEQLKDIKGKLDNAYGARDDALKKIAAFEQEQKEAEMKRLEEEGKHKELYELKLAEANAKAKALEERNVVLTRDIRVKDALKSLDFRNTNATEMAYKEIVADLVQSETGDWVHRSGVSIDDYVKSFADNEENSFLFKAKVNTGAGTTSVKSTDTSSAPKSLFDMSQEDVIKLAMEGKLPSS